MNFRSLLDLLFPPVCVVCGKGLVTGEQYFCTACLLDFPLVDEDFSNQEVILQRFPEAIRPEKFHALFYYNRYGKYKNLIYAVKYHSRRNLGTWLGRLLGEQIQESCKADCIIPIPLHPRRERKRGFNQAYQIALGIHQVLGTEIFRDVVVRTCNNVSQTGKSAEERAENVRHIFELQKPEKIQGRHVLLVDDVMTTGSTMASCLEVLALAGNVRFSLACLAHATGI